MTVLERLPDIEAIQTTAHLAEESPCKANGAILRRYFDLSHALGRLLHGDPRDGVPENATFPTFAAWVTESLRPDVLRSVDRSAGRDAAARLRPARRLYTRMVTEVLAGDDKVGRNIVRGEAAVFEEIATAIRLLLEYALRAIPEDRHQQPTAEQWSQAWDEFSSDLRAETEHLDEHRSDPLDNRDAHLLQRAMQPYFEVMWQGLSGRVLTDAQRQDRAQLILLANVRVLAYEQQRVQPVLRRNLAFVPDAFRARLGRELMGRNRLSDRLLRNAWSRAEAARDVFETAFQIAATRNAFSMVLGTEELRFGRDLPLPPPANPVLRKGQPEEDRKHYAPGAFFPYDLENLRSRPVWAAFHLHDRSMGEGARTGVDNWLRYGERMSFLVNLFRSRQQVSALYDLPQSTPSLAVARRPVDLAATMPPEPGN